MGAMQVTGRGRLEKHYVNKTEVSYFFVASVATGLEGSPSGTAELRFPITYRDYTIWKKQLESSDAECPMLTVKGDLEVSVEAVCIN